MHRFECFYLIGFFLLQYDTTTNHILMKLWWIPVTWICVGLHIFNRSYKWLIVVENQNTEIKWYVQCESCSLLFSLLGNGYTLFIRMTLSKSTCTSILWKQTQWITCTIITKHVKMNLHQSNVVCCHDWTMNIQHSCKIIKKIQKNYTYSWLENW